MISMRGTPVFQVSEATDIAKEHIRYLIARGYNLRMIVAEVCIGLETQGYKSSKPPALALDRVTSWLALIWRKHLK